MKWARLWFETKARLAPFVDPSAWVLLLVSGVPLFFIDPAMLLTLVQWTAYGLALAGVTVVISRVIFPQIRLQEWLEVAARGNIAAGLVVAALIFMISMIFLGLVLWAKA